MPNVKIITTPTYISVNTRVKQERNCSRQNNKCRTADHVERKISSCDLLARLGSINNRKEEHTIYAGKLVI